MLLLPRQRRQDRAIHAARRGEVGAWCDRADGIRWSQNDLHRLQGLCPGADEQAEWGSSSYLKEGGFSEAWNSDQLDENKKEKFLVLLLLWVQVSYSGEIPWDEEDAVIKDLTAIAILGIQDPVRPGTVHESTHNVWKFVLREKIESLLKKASDKPVSETTLY